MSESAAVVLIVEDDEPARRLSRAISAPEATRSTEAVDVRDALRLWDNRRPDLILLDLGLPDFDGQAVIRRVRREANTPIIVVSRAAARRIGLRLSMPAPMTT